MLFTSRVFTGMYDLSGFRSQMKGGYINALDKDSHNYYFDPCGPISTVTCTGADVKNEAVHVIGSCVSI